MHQDAFWTQQSFSRLRVSVINFKQNLRPLSVCLKPIVSLSSQILIFCTSFLQHNQRSFSTLFQTFLQKRRPHLSDFLKNDSHLIRCYARISLDNVFESGAPEMEKYSSNSRYFHNLISRAATYGVVYLRDFRNRCFCTIRA